MFVFHSTPIYGNDVVFQLSQCEVFVNCYLWPMTKDQDHRVAFIREFIDRFGGRPSGSEKERKAQLHFKQKLDEISPNAQVHNFENAIGAKFGSLKLFCLGLWVSLALFPFFPIPAAALGVLTLVFYAWHFLFYGDVLDFLWPKKKSSNVFAVLEPQKEATSTLWFSGHMDSVREFQWWYRLKTLGMVFTLVGGTLFVVWGVTSLVYLILFLPLSGESLGLEAEWHPIGIQIVYWIVVGLSPAGLSKFFMHGKVEVDGANDNLSGVAMAYSMGKRFLDPAVLGKNTLEHTRIGVISFGCEEMGLKGAKSFAKKHKEWLLETNSVLINIDTIKDPEFLTLVEGEKNPLVTYPKDLVARMGTAFEETNTPVIRTVMSVGATDGAAWHKAGIPSLSIIGMDSKNLDPCYHTRLDTLEHLNPAAMADLEEVLVQFVKKWDQEQPKVGS